MPAALPFRNQLRGVMPCPSVLPCPSVARPALPCQSVAPTGRAVMGYRDHQLRLTPVAGNYNSVRGASDTVSPLTLRGESDHCQSRSGYCQMPQTSVFYIEHGQLQQPGYTQSNSMFAPSKVTYHLADIAPILRSRILLPETNQTGTVTSSSRFATSRRPAFSSVTVFFS